MQWRKVKKCSQCGFASTWHGALRTQLTMHGEKTVFKLLNVASVSMYPLWHAIWGPIWKPTVAISGERSNKCNRCDFASSDASDLRKHLKMHSGEKSNKCNQCDFASSQAGNLKRHLKTHTGEKPYKCIQCDFASSWTRSLKTHMKKHGNVWYLKIYLSCLMKYIALFIHQHHHRANHENENGWYQIVG